MLKNTVVVYDSARNKLPCCNPARARKLLSKNRAYVVSMSPFSIALINKVVGPQSDTEDKEAHSDVTGMR